jgi:hypothetical protein
LGYLDRRGSSTLVPMVGHTMRKVSGDTEYTKTKREKWVKQKLHTVDQSVYNKVKFKKGQTDDTKSTIDKGATKHQKNSLNNDKNNDINDNKKAPEQQSTSSSTTCTIQINTQKQRIERKKGTDKNLESNKKIKKNTTQKQQVKIELSISNKQQRIPTKQKEELLQWLKGNIKQKSYSHHQNKFQNKQTELQTKQEVEQERKKEQIKANKQLLFNNFKLSIYDHDIFETWLKYIITDGKKYNKTDTYFNNTKVKNFYEPLFCEHTTLIPITQIMTDMTDSKISIRTTDDTSMDDNTPTKLQKTRYIKKKGNKLIDWSGVEEDEDAYIKRMIEVADNERTLLTKENGMTSKKLMLEKINKIQCKNDDKENKNRWETVGTKTQQREENQMFEDTSEKFLPMYLPSFESEVYEQNFTKYRIPLTITIKNKRNNNMGFKGTRMLVAMLKALQIAHHDTYLTTIEDNNDINDISHHTLIPTDQKMVKQFIMEPLLGANKTFSTKIVIKTNHELKDYLNNSHFRTYITNESINLEYNSLPSIIPYNVGYIEQITTNRDTTTLHQQRIRMMLENDIPEFQITLQRIYNKQGKSTFVAMVQSEKENVNIIINKLSNREKSDNFYFFPWSVYMSLPKEKKETLYQEQRLWNYNFRSIIIDGFQNNNDIATILMNSDEQIGEFVKVYTVTEYLQQLKHPITNVLMFDYVYPTILGKRELIISIENLGDSESYAANLKGELGRLMEPNEIIKEFVSMSEVNKLTLLPPWQPFTRGALIEASNSTNKVDSRTWSKRSRTDMYDNKNYATNQTRLPRIIHGNLFNKTSGSYSDITKNDTTLISSVTSSKTDNYNPECFLTSKILVLEDTIKELQQQVTIHSEKNSQVSYVSLKENENNNDSKYQELESRIGKEISLMKEDIQQINNKIDISNLTTNEILNKNLQNMTLLMQQNYIQTTKQQEDMYEQFTTNTDKKLDKNTKNIVMLLNNRDNKTTKLLIRKKSINTRSRSMVKKLTCDNISHMDYEDNNNDINDTWYVENEGELEMNKNDNSDNNDNNNTKSGL